MSALELWVAVAGSDALASYWALCQHVPAPEMPILSGGRKSYDSDLPKSCGDTKKEVMCLQDGKSSWGRRRGMCDIEDPQPRSQDMSPQGEGFVSAFTPQCPASGKASGAQ